MDPVTRHLRRTVLSNPTEYDVCVAGAGNAALCAAISAAESGARVLVLERAPESENGGNSRFTAGGIRFVYDGPEDLIDLCDLSDEEIRNAEFGSYSESEFFDDMFRVTEFRCDPDLVEVLVTKSRDTVRWLRGKGVRFIPMYGRQAFKIDGKFRFWGGLSNLLLLFRFWGGMSSIFLAT